MHSALEKPMNDSEIMAPPEIGQPTNPPSKFQREMAAFRRLLPELLQQYRNQYVAIHDEKVVGNGDNLISVAKDAYARFGYQPIYVDLVTDKVTLPIRIPSPRVVKSA
jgi:hypothetical protein